MASTNTALFFGILVFFTVLSSIVGLVAGDLALAAQEDSIEDALSDIQSEGGFFTVLFVWVATFLIDTLGFEQLGLVYLGFASLPEWLNLMIFVPMVFMYVFALAIILIPGVG